jgi:hypothetical protein
MAARRQIVVARPTLWQTVPMQRTRHTFSLPTVTRRLGLTASSAATTCTVATCTAVFLAGCPDPEVIRVAPQIFVDVCARPQRVIQNRTIGGYEECALPFGTADLSVRTEKVFTITNPSNLDLNLESVEIVGDPAFEFVEEPPQVIPSGLSAQLGVTIRPQLESTINADIIIISDANNTLLNDDGKSQVTIPVSLTGVDNGVPDIELIPQGCGTADPLGADFGRVATGGIAICTVEVRNNGTRELFFDDVDFVPFSDTALVEEPTDSNAEPAFAITGIVPGPDTPLRPTSDDVPPLMLRLTFAPDALGRFAALIRFQTSDPDEPVIDLPVAGIGVVGPTCVAKIKSVNGLFGNGAFDVEPLDDVVLTLEDSTPSTPNGAVVGYQWTLTDKGPDSGVLLSSPTTEETGFVFANRRGVDVAGRYEACATVTDELGSTSNNRCCVDFEAIPSQSFLVQLTWAQSSGDMDLHVTKKDGDGYCVESLGAGDDDVDEPFSTGNCDEDTDCYFSNCRAGDTNFPDWDGVAGRTTGDPSLDIDDLSGFGPENINVDLAVPGSYAFGATTYSSGGPYTMTMRLFIFGRLAGEWQQDGLSSEFWEVGAVHFLADDPSRPCVEDFTDGDLDDDCPGR